MANVVGKKVIKGRVTNNVIPINSKITGTSAINANISGGAVVPSATEEIKGIIRIATEAEAKAGVIHNAAITPYTLAKVLKDYIDESTKEKIDEILASLAELTEQVTEISESTKDIGLCWFPFNHDEWEEQNGVYTCVVPDVEAATGAFKDDENGKKVYVFSVDITIQSNQAILTSFEPFDGYLLGTYRTAEYKGEDEDDNEFTEEELEGLIISDWEDI